MAAQKPDIVYLRNEKRELYTNPLEDYWIARKRPRFELAGEDCRRGYVATWAIWNKELVLTGIKGKLDRRNILLFGRSVECTLRNTIGRYKGEGIKALWFTGKLRIPDGKMTEYVHEGYSSHFEREIILTVEKGVVIKEVILDYTQKRLVVTSVV
jgi:hypothetical protein